MLLEDAVDDDGLVGALVAEQVSERGRLPVEELAKDHASPL